jgi:glucose-6-phosphate 1-dehydrogenase
VSKTAETEANPLAKGLDRRRAAEPCTIVLFGATGDLTERKLVPALYNLGRDGLLPPKVAIVGVARRPVSDADFRRSMFEGVKQHARLYQDGDSLWEPFSESIFYHAAPFDVLEGYRSLAGRLETLESRLGLPGNRLFYLATAPNYFATIVKSLGAAGLARPAEGSGRWVRIVVEKPFGHDRASALALNRELLEVVEEKQIFRIDHYLGKETVQNLLALRFANGIFEPLWNYKYVNHVQITVAEDLGVEGRGGYYDKAGALRDMVQNHLSQVLCMVAMEPPVAMEADAIRDEKVKVLRSIRRRPPGEVDRYVVRGQFTRGSILGREVPGYLEEENVAQGSRTETFVALRLEIENWRWAGVPFLLRTGKRLAKKASEICIQFTKPPLPLFGDQAARTVQANALIINVQPDEGISLRFGAKVPGPDVLLRQVKMDFRYGSSFGVPSPEAYERLLLDAMAGDATLFTRRDEIEAQWAYISDVQDGWGRSASAPFPYPAGSWGPAEADRLLEGVEGGWRRL